MGGWGEDKHLYITGMGTNIFTLKGGKNNVYKRELNKHFICAVMVGMMMLMMRKRTIEANILVSQVIKLSAEARIFRGPQTLNSCNQ